MEKDNIVCYKESELRKLLLEFYQKTKYGISVNNFSDFISKGFSGEIIFNAATEKKFLARGAATELYGEYKDFVDALIKNHTKHKN